jgi:transcriptional regulator of aroF, aroG, tyrA and aromatic amino acid transport
VSVEVNKEALYLECQIVFEEQKPQLMRELQQVDGIDKVSEVSSMPAKERAEQLEAILTSFQDGVLAVNFMDLSFASPAMKKVVEEAQLYAASSSTVLIRGETGTGKPLLARALYSISPRAGMPFLTVNCATLPDALLERNLFGYEEGEFTGATKKGTPGLFELANGGTLFLNEVGEVPLCLQNKLQRVLKEKRVRRLGSSRDLPVDVRLIAATHRNLEEMMKRRLFREDLYYRLNVLPLFVPPLRNCAEDILPLAEHFLNRCAAELDTPVRRFSPEAIEKLQTYVWPGNIQELGNRVERAVHLVDGTEIRPEHIYIGMKSLPVKPAQIQFETYQTLKARLGEVERDILQATMRRFRSSRQAGAVLGLSHTAVLKKLKKHGLQSGSH